MKKDKESQQKYTLDELQGKAPAAWLVILATVGLLAIAVGIALPIINYHRYSEMLNSGIYHPEMLQSNLWKFIFAGGALLFLAAKLFTPYTGTHPRIKRLYRIEAWSAVFFCVAAFFAFYDGTTTRDVWAFTLAGGAILIFTTLAIPYRIKKILKSQN